MSNQTNTPRVTDYALAAGGTVTIRLSNGEYAICDAEDLAHFSRLGISTCWQANPDGKGRVYVSAWVDGRTVQVARLIMEVDTPRRIVKYRNGDRLNLRKSNLYVADGAGAKGREHNTIMDRESLMLAAEDR